MKEKLNKILHPIKTAVEQVAQEYERKIDDLVDKFQFEISEMGRNGTTQPQSEEDYSYVYEATTAHQDFLQPKLYVKGDLAESSGRNKKILLRESDGWVMLGIGGTQDVARVQELPELLDLQDAAFNKTHTDPHIKNIVNNIQYFTIGKGMRFEAADEKVQEILLNFWALNNMNSKQKMMVKSSFIEGEYFILYFVNTQTGRIKWRRIPNKDITEIETHPEDVETILSYRRDFYSGTEARNAFYQDINYEVQLEDGLDSAKSGQTFSEDKYIQFIKYGEENELRGRVPLDTSLQWAKLYKDWVYDRARLNHERSKVVWIKTMKSGRYDLKNFSATPQRSPKGGMMLIETPTVSYRIESPKMDSQDAKEDGLAILYMLGASVNLPLIILDQRADEQTYSCHDDKTEILTPDGWLRHDEIEDDTIVGTVNPNTHKFEWQKINEKMEYDYKGKMLEIDGRGTNACVTPNHDLWIGKPTSNSKINWEKHKVDSIPVGNFKVKTSLEWEDNYEYNYVAPTENWLRLCACYIGDGSLNIGKHETYNQYRIRFEFKKQRKIDYFDSALKSYNFKILTTKRGTTTYILEDKELYCLLEEFFGRYSYEKKIPDSFFKYTLKEKRIFFDALMQTDGYYTNESNNNFTLIEYTTTSKDLAEDVFLLALQLGYRVHIREKIPRKKHWKKLYSIGMCECKVVELTKENIKEIDYEGKVWCVNVDNGLIVTRRNYKIAVHGNSIRHSSTPFSQSILSNQDFWSDNFDKMFRFVIRKNVEAKVLKSTTKVPKFTSSKKLEEIQSTIIEMIAEGESNDAIIKKVKPMVSGKLEEVEIPTEEISIAKIFPDVVKEDPFDQARVLEIYRRIGIASIQTLSEKAGFDWKQELWRKSIDADNAVPPESYKRSGNDYDNKNPDAQMIKNEDLKKKENIKNTKIGK